METNTQPSADIVRLTKMVQWYSGQKQQSDLLICQLTVDKEALQSRLDALISDAPQNAT